MSPRSIVQTGPTELRFTWQDGTESTLSLKLLRDECPCANCKGENILGKVYRPLQLPTFTPGMYEIASLEPVGNYAMQISWKDGHNTGIYTWEYLQVLAKTEST